METETIEYNGKRLGFILRNVENAEGREFPSKDEDFMQVGVLGMKKGEWVMPHVHKVYDRVVNKTQKAVYVVSGQLKVHFYIDKKEIKQVLVGSGDVVVLLAGGFGFECSEDCKIIEFKQGPYIDVEQDKIKLDPNEIESFEGEAKEKIE